MTELLTVEFADETGATRRLGRDELLLYLQVIATAGSETTTRLLGWAGKVLAEHPDQRRDMANNRTLLPAAIEEGQRDGAYRGRRQPRSPPVRGGHQQRCAVLRL